MRKADLFSMILWKILCVPIGAFSPAVPLTQFGASDPKPWHSAGAYRVVLLDSPLHIWLTREHAPGAYPTPRRRQAQLNHISRTHTPISDSL